MILSAASELLMAFTGGWWFLPVPLLWILLIIGIVFLVRGRDGRPPWTGSGRETARDVLDRRFAAGELSQEQFRERRSVLEEKR